VDVRAENRAARLDGCMTDADIRRNTDEARIMRNAMNPICGQPHQVREGNGYHVPGHVIQIPAGYLLELGRAHIAVYRAEQACQEWYVGMEARLKATEEDV